MPTNNDVQDASLHSTQLWFMVMSSVLFVSLIYSSAVQVIPVRQITTWLLGIGVADVLHPKKLIKNEVII